MALFTLADVNNTPPLLPTLSGGPATMPNPTHVVTLTLSNGTVQQIGTVDVLMRLLQRMVDLGVWYLLPTEDIIVLRVGFKGLLICEATYQNSKLLNAAAPCYDGGLVQFAMRSSAQVLTLDEALSSVGHYRTLATAYASDWDLQQEPAEHNPRMRFVDYKWSSSAANATQGSLLGDAPPLFWNYAMS